MDILLQCFLMFISFLVGTCVHFTWLNKKIEKGYFEYKDKEYIIREKNDRKYL